MERREPELRALLPEPGRRDRLRGEARALEARWPDASARPPLFGELVAVKDIFRVDGFETRAGSALPPRAFAGAEATVVSRLREAGALVLGKTVTTEFAYFEPGATTNPHDARRTPGGSSSGSAAAVAAGYARLALGSQTVGSVIRPAAFCGVVGFKPSYGRIPSDGMLAFSESVDCVGLFARDLAGIGHAARAVVDGWRDDAPTALPRLAVPEGPYLAPVEPAARASFEATLEKLLAAGVTIERVPVLDDIDELVARHQELIAAEFARAHAPLFAEHGALYRARSAMLFDRGRSLGPDAIERGRESIVRTRAALERTLDERGLDLFVSPAACGAAPSGLGSTGDPAMNLPWTHARLPVVTLPAGSSDPGAMPLGLQLSARLDRDEGLLAQAARLGTLLKR